MRQTERIYFLADMHLKPLDAPNRTAREMAVRDNERLAEFLLFLEGRASSLILVGDTFNFWFERRGRVVGDYFTALSLFKAAADKGLSIHHLSGNRDFAVGEGLGLDPKTRYPGFFRFSDGFTVSRMCDFGIEPHGLRYRFHHSGKTVGCLHGDTLCAGDYAYRVLRWLLQGPVGRSVMRYSPWLAADVVFSRQQGRVGVRGPERRPEPLFDERAVWREMAMGADLLLCGHVHERYERDIVVDGRRCHLAALPAWLDGGYGYLENGELHIEKFPEI